MKDLEKAQMLPDVINTTILSSGFYLKTETGTKLDANEIFGAWRFIHNQTISRLMGLGIMDRYGRFTVKASTAKRTIIRSVDIKPGTMIDPVYESLREFIFNYGKEFAMPEWLMVFPKDFLTLAVLQISNQLTNQSIDFLRLSENETRVEMPLMYLIGDNSTFHINPDGRISLEISLENQFGNMVTFVVRSNSSKTDWFLNDMAKREHNLQRLSVVIGTHKDLARSRKLLCSFITNKTNIIIPRYPESQNLVGPKFQLLEREVLK